MALGQGPIDFNSHLGHLLTSRAEVFFLLTSFSFSYHCPKLGAGEVAQVVACLPRKHEALSSNPSTTEKKNENKVG
jgi:hypothetical protein